jgi:hypothetical protein
MASADLAFFVCRWLRRTGSSIRKISFKSYLKAPLGSRITLSWPASLIWLTFCLVIRQRLATSSDFKSTKDGLDSVSVGVSITFIVSFRVAKPPQFRAVDDTFPEQGFVVRRSIVKAP